ncbi:hypothetical protein P3L10_020369 [Capsicum annuum]
MHTHALTSFTYVLDTHFLPHLDPPTPTFSPIPTSYFAHRDWYIVFALEITKNIFKEPQPPFVLQVFLIGLSS